MQGSVSEEVGLTSVEAMYARPLEATRTGPLYNAFSYPTKISPEAIGLFIATHTAVGATIVDVFAGSGTTGVATLLSERPTLGMIEQARRLGLEPQWGPRNAHLFDVGVLGSFIGRVLTDPPAPHQFEAAASELLERAADRMNDAYSAVDPEGEIGCIRHVIWSEVIRCPTCSTTFPIWEVAVRRDPAEFAKSFSCSACGTEYRVDDCERLTVEQPDIFGLLVTTRLRVPVEVHGITGRKKWSRPALASDFVQNRSALPDLPPHAPMKEIAWGELHRAGYHTGISHLHHFYTARNFTALAICMELTHDWPEPMRSALQFLVLSYNASHSTLMTRIVAKKNQRDFVLTGAQSGVLYVSGLPVEKNVITGIRRKISTISAAFAITHGAIGNVVVHNRSSENLPLEDASVDYVFTDPPFGDYIPYAEINQINEIWLGAVTRREDETIVSESAAKDVDSYERSMTAVMSEAARILKPTGLMTVVFHSAHSRIWRALTSSFASAGLRIRITSVLDKVQASFKQVVANVSVKGDPLILLDKSPNGESTVTHATIVDEVVMSAVPMASPDIRALYSTYAAKCLAAGQEIELDAADFSRMARSALGLAA